jgi:hypothetical protein
MGLPLLLQVEVVRRKVPARGVHLSEWADFRGSIQRIGTGTLLHWIGGLMRGEDAFDLGSGKGKHALHRSASTCAGARRSAGNAQ